MWSGALLLSLVAAASSAGPPNQNTPPADCAVWQDCRAEVEAALAAEAFERAHDLAWRAVQKGPKDDPALMFLLARAQSMAGRPQDALVMVRRLAERGVPTDALTHPDLARTRDLEGWAEVEGLVARANSGEPSPRVLSSGSAATPPASPAAVGPATGPTVPSPRAGGATARGTLVVETGSITEETLRFATDQFVPAGLAYDAVSRRFVIGDELGRKLRVVGEGLDHAVDLVRAESASFLDVRALAIDTRRGDLWVATSDPETGTLHRLQLISGRPLQALPIGEAGQAVRPVDLAVAESGLVFVLDRDGRILRARPGAAAVETVMTLRLDQALSLALVSGGTVAYVTHASGLLRVDLEARTSAEVASVAELPLTGIERLRTHRDGLIALQRGTEGNHRLLRLELARNGRGVRGATAYDVRVEAGSSPAAFTVSGDEVSLVTGGLHTPGEVGASPSAIGPPADLVVRRFRLR